MNDNELKNALKNIKVKDNLKQKIVQKGRVTKIPPKINFRRPAIAAAACLIVILTAIGIPCLKQNSYTGTIQVEYLSLLSVKAYAASSGGNTSSTNGTELQQGTKIVLGSYSELMSSVPGYPFEFLYPNAEIEILVNNGNLCVWGEETDSKVINKGQSYTIDNSGKIYWSPLSKDEIINDRTILEFHILEKDNIIGVGLIEITRTETNGLYSAELLGLRGFPKSNGEYQKVSKDRILDFKAKLLN